jgi:hypothetical protein
MHIKYELRSSILTCFKADSAQPSWQAPALAVQVLIDIVRQVRARQAAAHQAVDWLYPASAAVVFAATELLADDAIPWSPAVLELVSLKAECATVTSNTDLGVCYVFLHFELKS